MKSFIQYMSGKQIIQLEKGLTRKEALTLASKKLKGDARGFTYDEKTGIATFI